MNQRGDVTDIPLIIVVVLVMAISAVLGVLILSQMGTLISNQPEINDTLPPEVGTVMNAGHTAATAFDTLLVVVFFGAIAVGMMSAFLAPSHPAFFMLYIIVMLIFGALTTVFSNIYYEFASNSLIAPYANEFPYLNLLFGNLPLLAFTGMLLIAIVMFGKSTQGGGGNY